jgi:hypothetical protein
LMDLAKTPMVPYPEENYDFLGGTTPLEPVHIVNEYTRSHFVGWLEEYAIKVKKDDQLERPLQNLLRLRVRTSYKVSEIPGRVGLEEAAGAAIVAAAATGMASMMVNQSNVWDGGDDLAYDSFTIRENIYNGKVEDPPGEMRDSWTVNIFTWSFDSDGTFSVLSFSENPDALAPSTGGNSFLGNNTTFEGFDFSDRYIYGEYTGNVVDYGTAITGFSTTVQSYNLSGYYSSRSEDQGQDPHGLENLIELNDQTDISPKAPTPNLGFLDSVAPFSFKHADTDQIYGTLQRFETVTRWVYTPDAATCGPCWYKDKEVEVEVTFVKALVTHTNGEEGGGTATLGEWEEHSTETFNLTLPDSINETELDEDFNIPEEDGYIVAISDIKLVSIT